jgi:hypothetical protein
MSTCSHLAGEDVTEPLLEGDFDNAPTGSGRAASGDSHGPILNILSAVKHGLSACVTTLAHCVDWLWSSFHVHLTDDQLDKLTRLRTALSDKYDPQNPSHQVRSASQHTYFMEQTQRRHVLLRMCSCCSAASSPVYLPCAPCFFLTLQTFAESVIRALGRLFP